MTLSDVQHILTVRRQVMERHRDRIAAADAPDDAVPCVTLVPIN